MSSGMSRTEGYLSAIFRYGVLGLAVSGVVLGAVYIAVGLILQNSDTSAAQTRLSRYQHLYASGGPHALQMSFAAPAGSESGFLRLAGPHLRLILVTGSSTTGSGVNFPDFDTFPPTLNRSWVSLQQHGGKKTWTVVSTQLKDGNVLQLGIDSSKTLELRRRIGSIILLIGLLLAPLSFIPAWYQAARNRKKIIRLRRVLEAAAEGRKTAAPLPAVAATEEEAQLVEAVQRLLSRHERLVRELQESMDNVAHDLRTPMTRLRTMAEYGLQETGNSGRLREALADCLEESERVLSMLNTMLSVAEAEAETVALDLQPVNLGETIADVVDLYEIIAEEKNIALEFTAPAPVMILADRARIGQVWANLVDNAVKYGATLVQITLAAKDDMAEVRVKDNGMGISAAETDRIWERLFRGDRSRSRQGLGLGLTLVKAMVLAHRGTIEVASELGQGTVFTVRLPPAPEQEKRA